MLSIRFQQSFEVPYLKSGPNWYGATNTPSLGLRCSKRTSPKAHDVNGPNGVYEHRRAGVSNAMFTMMDSRQPRTWGLPGSF